MKIKKDEVEHIAKLAKLQLNETEVELYQKQLGAILDYVDMIKKLKLPEDSEQMAHVSGLVNVFRVDEVEGCDTATRKRIVESFPRHEGELLESPTVFENREE